MKEGGRGGGDGRCTLVEAYRLFCLVTLLTDWSIDETVAEGNLDTLRGMANIFGHHNSGVTYGHRRWPRIMMAICRQMA